MPPLSKPSKVTVKAIRNHVHATVKITGSAYSSRRLTVILHRFYLARGPEGAAAHLSLLPLFRPTVFCPPDMRLGG